MVPHFNLRQPGLSTYGDVRGPVGRRMHLYWGRPWDGLDDAESLTLIDPLVKGVFVLSLLPRKAGDNVLMYLSIVFIQIVHESSQLVFAKITTDQVIQIIKEIEVDFL